MNVAVNLSPVQLKHNQIGPMVNQALKAAGLHPGSLELEITEGVLIETLESGDGNCLYDLAARGIRLAIDDFGVGYSSLAYLKELPVGKIKIDRSFVSGVGINSEDDALVRAIIAVGHSLGKRVVAEGVETERQLTLCSQWGCDEVQGYFVGRPQTAEQVEKSRF